MGGLAHYLEASGIATTQVSLIRLHTEKTRPPRALWVPFELGRPFGSPSDAEFQRRVVLASLRLLEAGSGPVLEDFPEEAPAAARDDTGWACPVNFSAAAEPLGGDAALVHAMTREIAELAPWYDRTVAARGRTTVGVSGLDIDAIAALYAAMLDDALPPSPLGDVPLAEVLRLAAEDLKAYYYEAATAQPGAATPAELSDWFWRETRASEVLRIIKERFIASEDPDTQFIGHALMVPAHQA